MPKGRLGYIALGSFLFALWLAIAILLWHWAMSTPMPPEDEKGEPFEFMPRAEGS